MLINVQKYSVYREELYMPLIESMRACSSSKTTLILGMTREFTTPLFFKKLGQFFTYNLLFTPDPDNSNIGLFVCYLIQ